MLTVKFITENRNEVIERLAIRNIEATELVDNIICLDGEKRATQHFLDNTKSEYNSLSKEIGILMKNGKAAEAESAKQKTAELKEEIKRTEEKLEELEKQLYNILVTIPNLPHKTVPRGKTPDDNLKTRESGNIPNLPESALPHWELAKKYDIIDFELGVKLTGAGFPVYKGKGAKMQRALISFFLDEAERAGYTEIMPPLMVNEDSGFGTGQLPDKEGQMYFVGLDNFYLIPTAEVPVTNLYRDVILNATDFPVKNMAYTPCFRREAGSYGAHVRGLNRLHQFDKVEIVQLQHPDKSYETLDEMVKHVEGLVQKLELPYRILKLCGGDMGFASATTFDFEVFAAAQKKWLEVSSVSNFESFQANRMKLRFKEKDDKKTTLAHTLNGSALALPRILASILENNQTEKGIKVPKVLVPYTNFEWID